MVLVGGWSLLSTHHQGVPVVQADPGPVRVKPANPGGLQVAGAGNDIFSGGSDTGVDKLAPAPETPDPQALRAPPPPPPKPSPAAVAAAPAAPPAAPVVARTPAAPPVSAAQNTSHAITPAPQPVIASAPLKRVEPAPAAKPAVTPEPNRVGRGGALVQLAALSSEEAAKAEWTTLSKRMPDLLAGHQASISKVEHGGHVFWRVRTGGFNDVAQASAFCGRVRAKGASCAVADF